MTEEEDYSLQESRDKVGTLPIPMFSDLQGNLIDGIHRSKIGFDVPTVKLPIKNRLQFLIVRMAVNGCRRTWTATEKTECLREIAQLCPDWTPKNIAEHIPFSYQWVMKYLPDELKEKTWTRETAIPQHRIEHEDVPLAKTELPSLSEEPPETPQEFAEHFTETFNSHITQLTKKDIPIIITYMNEDHNCEECDMKDACELLLDLGEQLREQLPICMKKKLTNQTGQP